MFAVAGAMFASSALTSNGEDLRDDEARSLRDAISDRAAALVPLGEKVDALAATVAELIETSDPEPALARTTQQIEEISPMAGLTEVRGPGVTVVLDDGQAPDPIPDGFTGDDYVVHQQDVQGVVNALWRGGASGVTVMGYRLTSADAVRCVGNTVILQGRVHSPPFVIEGVGDVGSLLRALDNEPAVQLFREWSDIVGLGYQQTAATELVLPAYSGPISPKFATVAR